jgi:hypothetical protein
MQITLNQDEIEEAIRNHVHGQVTIRESQEMSIDLRAGRGENGFTATLDVQPRSTGTSEPKQGPKLVIPQEEPEKAVRATPKAAKVTKVEAEKTSPEPTNEPEAKPAPKGSKKSIFAVAPKAAPEATETAETVEEVEPGVPDQETPAEEAAREEATQDESQTEEDTPAEQPEAKKSIFAFGPKKTA